jgi:hypothetical protein
VKRVEVHRIERRVVGATPNGTVRRMELSIVHDVHMAINFAHRFVYFVPEAAEEYAAVGVTGRGAYFSSRAAPLGAVPDEVIIATFYNFSPRAVTSAMSGVWDAASPATLQAARFRAVRRALDRVGAALPAAQITEASALIDPVVSGLDLGGKALAAANAAVPLPDDPMLALWQQVTVLREWRGDVHVALLVANDVGPCECMVLQVGSGRFPLGVTMATRQWDEREWAAAIARLATRGWVDANGAMTPTGTQERERIEADTDRLCAPIWHAVGDKGASRLGELIAPIHAAMDAAGTYAALA